MLLSAIALASITYAGRNALFRRAADLGMQEAIEH
jgi:hypothetical protein